MRTSSCRPAEDESPALYFSVFSTVSARQRSPPPPVSATLALSSNLGAGASSLPSRYLCPHFYITTPSTHLPVLSLSCSTPTFPLLSRLCFISSLYPLNSDLSSSSLGTHPRLPPSSLSHTISRDTLHKLDFRSRILLSEVNFMA